MSNPDSPAPFKYDAFLSYSHKDKAIADRLSDRIRRYRPPKSSEVAGKRLIIFRDEERLHAADDVREALDEPLSQANELVLLCSESSATAEYVNYEVKTFCELNDNKRPVLVVLDNPNEGLLKLLPLSLRREVNDPLYIDLSDTSRSSWREATLRLIAFLHDVSFDKLDQEDLRRRRRMWVLSFVGLSFLLFVLLNAYLTLTTPQSLWAQIEQPNATEQFGIREFLPIQEVAVNKQDPSIVLYRGRNAAWLSDEAFFYLPPADFDVDLANTLEADLPTIGLSKVIALIDVIVESESDFDEDPYGQGQVTLSASRTPDGTFEIYRTFRYTGFTKRDAKEVSLEVGPSLLQPGENPFDLGRFAENLVSAQLLYHGNVVRGVISITSTSQSFPVDFDMGLNLLDGFESREELWGQEHKIFTARDNQDIVVSGQTLSDRQNDPEFWNVIITDENWASHAPPLLANIDQISTDGGADEGADWIVEATDTNGGTTNLRELLASIEFWDGVDYFVGGTLITQNDRGTTQNTKLLKLDWYELQQRPNPLELVYTNWFGQLSSETAWFKTELPSETIQGIWSLDPDNGSAILLTTEKGVFVTEDFGNSWKNANYGEARLNNGKDVRLIVLADIEEVFALITEYSDTEEGTNPLLRLEHRDWIQKWRIGWRSLLN